MVAQTSSGTERSTLSTRLQGARQRGNASSRPSTAASRVPTTEMASVSHTPTATLRSHSALVSGGKKLMTNSSMDRPAAPVNSEGRSISSMAKLAATPSARAAQVRALRQPQALARAAGGVSSARRRPRESRSAPQTSSMKVSKMVEASPPLSIFMAWSMSWPRPPAPTKPMTTEARMAHSQR